MCSINRIFGHLSHGPHCNHILHMVITSRQTKGMTAQLGCLVSLSLVLLIITYYCTYCKPEGSSFIS